MTDREPARSFEDLIVWQKAHDVVLGVYRATRAFPQDELGPISFLLSPSS